MPKKDTTSAVVGMLSSVGARTRASEAAVESPPSAPSTTAPTPAPEPVPTAVGIRTEEQPASVSSLPPARVTSSAAQAPRTIRLSPSAAQQLRDAWLEAKRDDVLLTAQDFASSLVEEALHRRRPARSTASR